MTLFQKIAESHFRVVFGRLPPGVVGEAGDNVVTVDLRAANPLKVYIHECIHLLEPSWSESAVLRAERKLYRELSRYDRFQLWRKLFRRKFRMEE